MRHTRIKIYAVALVKNEFSDAVFKPHLTLKDKKHFLAVVLKCMYGGCEDIKKMRFSAKFERGFPVCLKTHFRLRETIIGGRKLKKKTNIPKQS